MALAKSKGNMYQWVTHVWSPIRGCRFGCAYCYARKHGQEFRLDEEDLQTKLGRGKIIFVGHLSDMWGPWVPTFYLIRVLNRCKDFRENEYIFQSKNPDRFRGFSDDFRGMNVALGTTIETNAYPGQFRTEAPPLMNRITAMRDLKFRKFITIEPVMDFDVRLLTEMVSIVRPEFVTIGADSKGHNLVEPCWEKVEELIERLSDFTEIRQKTNLERLERGRPKVNRPSRDGLI